MQSLGRDGCTYCVFIFQVASNMEARASESNRRIHQQIGHFELVQNAHFLCKPWARSIIRNSLITMASRRHNAELTHLRPGPLGLWVSFNSSSGKSSIMAGVFTVAIEKNADVQICNAVATLNFQAVSHRYCVLPIMTEASR